MTGNFTVLSPEVSAKLERLEDALDHIMRVTRQSNTMTSRLKWCELRAKSALENTQEWKEYDYPRNRTNEKKNLRSRTQRSEAKITQIIDLLDRVQSDPHHRGNVLLDIRIVAEAE